MEKTDIITCLKKRKKDQKNIKKIIVRLEGKLIMIKRITKLLSQRYFLFVLLLIFKR